MEKQTLKFLTCPSFFSSMCSLSFFSYLSRPLHGHTARPTVNREWAGRSGGSNRSLKPDSGRLLRLKTEDQFMLIYIGWYNKYHLHQPNYY